MPLHAGRTYRRDSISIAPPDVQAIRRGRKAADVADSVMHWLSQAATGDDIHYFAIYRDQDLVGQIMLHDIDRQSGEALVGYHLFEAHFRGHGVGTQALALLQEFVSQETDLNRLVVITSRDNLASQRVARKCGFEYSGTAREDRVNGVVFQWRVGRARQDGGPSGADG